MITEYTLHQPHVLHTIDVLYHIYCIGQHSIVLFGQNLKTRVTFSPHVTSHNVGVNLLKEASAIKNALRRSHVLLRFLSTDRLRIITRSSIK